jgi:hypothetical protein
MSSLRKLSSHSSLRKETSMNRPLFLGAALAAILAAPLAASAQAWGGDEHRFVGRVISFKPWNLQLDNGPHIFLHPGTVIHPTGMTLANGMVVRVIGHRTSDGNFAADEVDLLPAPPAFRRFE